MSLAEGGWKQFQSLRSNPYKSYLYAMTLTLFQSYLEFLISAFKRGILQKWSGFNKTEER